MSRRQNAAYPHPVGVFSRTRPAGGPVKIPNRRAGRSETRETAIESPRGDDSKAYFDFLKSKLGRFFYAVQCQYGTNFVCFVGGMVVNTSLDLIVRKIYLGS